MSCFSDFKDWKIHVCRPVLKNNTATMFFLKNLSSYIWVFVTCKYREIRLKKPKHKVSKNKRNKFEKAEKNCWNKQKKV